MSSWKSLNGPGAPVSWLDEECLPETTFLDVTCGSPLPGGMPATPLTARSMNIRFTSLQPSQLNSSTPLNSTAQILCPQKKSLDPLKSNLSSPKAESQTSDTKPSRQNGTETLSETSSSHDAQENNFKGHSLELSKHNRTASTDSDDKMVELSESMYAPMRWLDARYFPEITLLDVTRESEISHVGELSSLEVTQGSILENSMPSLEPSGSNMVKSQTSAEETCDTPPSNVTCDINSSGAVSVQCAASQFSTSDMQCDTSSKNVTSELHGEPPVTSNAVEANDEEPLASHDAELTSKETQPSSETTGSVNSTLTSLQPSQLSSSIDLSPTAQVPCSQNTTLDLPPSNVNSPKVECEATDQATSVSKNTTETSPVIDQTFSAEKANGSSDTQNPTFDGHSLHKSSGDTFLGDAGAAIVCLQNNTFDTKPKQNGTITYSETSSSDSCRNTFDHSTPLQFCNATSSPKENNSEARTPEDKGTLSSTDPHTKMVDTHGSTFEVNPAVEVVSGAGQCETRDQSQSALPLTDGLSDTLGHENMDVENNKANPFNLDDTLDLRADFLITSTPMTTNTILSMNILEGKSILGQRRLDAQFPSDGPSNIACGRKTFLNHPAAKSLLPPSRAASQLSKHKPASTLSGRCNATTSGLPMTRQRTQAEALRNAAAPHAPQTTGLSSFYKFRASTTGSKQPNSGLQRPQLSGIPLGIQRAATGLRPPSARSNAAASSNSNRLRGPAAATNPVTKTSQAKKQPPSRGEVLRIAKRKRMDTSLPSNSSEASISSCDAANGAETMKPPTTSRSALPAKTQKDDAAVPARTESSTSFEAVGRARDLRQPASSHRALLAKTKGHDCANCVTLQQQLKMQSEQIRRLKEELLKKK